MPNCSRMRRVALPGQIGGNLVFTGADADGYACNPGAAGLPDPTTVDAAVRGWHMAGVGQCAALVPASC